MIDAKEAFVKEHAPREQASSSNEEYGTKASGFAGGGPFSCKNCVHKKAMESQRVCVHPKVNADPDLADRKRAGKFLIIDADDCCRYVRPS